MQSCQKCTHCRGFGHWSSYYDKKYVGGKTSLWEDLINSKGNANKYGLSSKDGKEDLKFTSEGKGFENSKTRRRQIDRRMKKRLGALIVEACERLSPESLIANGAPILLLEEVIIERIEEVVRVYISVRTKHSEMFNTIDGETENLYRVQEDDAR